MNLGQEFEGRRVLQYRPYGAHLEALYAKEPEVLLSGPAGTGKSRAILEKLHLIAEKYAGCRILILRKTRESLSESALVTFEEKVVPPAHPILNGPQRRMRQNYRYPNGSEIIVGGLDKPQKVMSTEYDIIYIQEAIECNEEDWEMVLTRLRNGVVPYQQLIADTNPDKPTHWLKVRCDEGKTRFIDTTHKDNPVLFNHSTGEWTPAGIVYLQKLDGLSGARYHRLRHGKWVGAEGAIYNQWDANVFVIQRFDVPRDWTRIWGVDFGYTNPFVWQNWALSPDDDLYLLNQIYMTQRLVEDHAETILEIKRKFDEPNPQVILCDHDAEDRATLKKYLGMSTRAAFKSVSPGIQAVQARLVTKPNGVNRINFFADSLYEVDQALVESKKPTKTEAEFDGYIWDTTGGQKKGDVPVKENDHGMDPVRYVVCFVDNVANGGTSLKPTITLATEDPRLEQAYGYKNAQRRALRAQRGGW